MELELRQEYISCWDNAYQTLMNQEETTEMIVPDACPDILQILDGEGKLLLQRKEAMDGKAELSGCIKVGILYQPEGENRVCSMEGILPFSTNLDSATITRSSKLMVCPKIQKVDVHVLNPRKVLIKVNFTLEVTCYTPQTQSVCSCVEKREQYGICEKVEEHQNHVVMAAQEKMFSYTDTLTLPAGNPDMEELLRFRTDCISQDAKVIGNKLLFKGEARVELMYRSRDGRPCTAMFPLPFSQMMEVGDVGEDSTPELRIIFTNSSCKRADEEGRSVSVELELMAQSVLSKTHRVALLTDLYSTECDMVDTRKTYTMGCLMDYGVAPESVRELLECTMPVARVLDVQLRPLQLANPKQGSEMTMNADVEAYVLFETEEGDCSSLHRRITVPHTVPISQQWDYRCDFSMSRQGSAMPASGGIEVSFTVEFSWSAMEKRKVQGIERASVEEKQPITGEIPSVIIRSVRNGECLWDIAKSYRTTENDIAEANALPTAELYAGQMLLIPR